MKDHLSYSICSYTNAIENTNGSFVASHHIFDPLRNQIDDLQLGMPILIGLDHTTRKQH